MWEGWDCGSALTRSDDGGGLEGGLRPASAPSVDTPPPTSPVAAPTVTIPTIFPARCKNSPSPRRRTTGGSASRLVGSSVWLEGGLLPRKILLSSSRLETAVVVACRYGSSDE